MDCSCVVAKKSIICHSERSEESRYYQVGVTEILPPFGRLNDTLCKQVYCPFLIPLLRGVGVCNTHLHSFFLCHSERSEESGYINFVFTDPSLRSG